MNSDSCRSSLTASKLSLHWSLVQSPLFSNWTAWWNRTGQSVRQSQVPALTDEQPVQVLTAPRSFPFLKPIAVCLRSTSCVQSGGSHFCNHLAPPQSAAQQRGQNRHSAADRRTRATPAVTKRSRHEP